MKLIKKILARLGIIKLVWLEDIDGELTLSIKRKHPFGGYGAYRMWFIGRFVKLHDDGSCSGPLYVKRWKEYNK